MPYLFLVKEKAGIRQTLTRHQINFLGYTQLITFLPTLKEWIRCGTRLFSRNWLNCGELIWCLSLFFWQIHASPQTVTQLHLSEGNRWDEGNYKKGGIQKTWHQSLSEVLQEALNISACHATGRKPGTLPTLLFTYFIFVNASTHAVTYQPNTASPQSRKKYIMLTYLPSWRVFEEIQLSQEGVRKSSIRKPFKYKQEVVWRSV